MLIDTVLYAGERDLLELRFEVLKEKVDLFVVVEGTLTFTGKPRTVKHDWCMTNHNVVHYIVSNFPEASDRNAWKREMHQRNQILKALPSSLKHDDLILVSDVDEIPDPKDIPNQLEPGELIRFQHEFYHFNFNNHVIKDESAKKGWSCTALCRLGDLNRWYPQGVRNQVPARIISSGWHFSYFWEPQNKIESFSHIELMQMEGSIQDRVQKRWDYTYEFVEGTKHLPQIIQDNPERWSKYFASDIDL